MEQCRNAARVGAARSRLVILDDATSFPRGRFEDSESLVVESSAVVRAHLHFFGLTPWNWFWVLAWTAFFFWIVLKIADAGIDQIMRDFLIFLAAIPFTDGAYHIV